MIVWVGFDPLSAMSAFAGGTAVALPNTLFALSLVLRMKLRGSISAVTLLGGEVVKLVLTVTLLVLAAKFGLRQPVWLAMIGGVVLAVKAQWLALWVTRKM
jgi:F0F1-type ATP synthase assembly protein I